MATFSIFLLTILSSILTLCSYYGIGIGSVPIPCYNLFLYNVWLDKIFSISVNGSPTEEFPLKRGLRQGDPLSPFLFLIAAEGLNVMITGYIVGTHTATVLSHLQFADDTLLLGTKSWANV